MKKEKDKHSNNKPDNSDNLNNNNSEDTKDQIAQDQHDSEILKYEEKLNTMQKELDENKDRLLRKAAEFENYKRRTENDQMNLLKYAAEGFIIRLLPVIDDFERSMQYIDTSADIEAVKQGVSLVYEKFRKLLEEQGVKKIEAVGKPFDVHYHEALMQRSDPDAEPHTVLQELESGYTYKDRVIRHSKVVVSDDASGPVNNTEE